MKKIVILIIGIMLAISIVPGCIDDDDDDEGGTIRICNSDDEEYRIELYRKSDNVRIGERDVEKWYHGSDVCDEFNDVTRGEYYLIIYEQGTSNYDRSEDFYLDDGDIETFTIESPGNIEKDDRCVQA